MSETLLRLSVEDPNNEETALYHSRLATLLDALRESRMLWHSEEPANSEEIRAAFFGSEAS
jgi:hypothetical protein